jgi:hypothetical protein
MVLASVMAPSQAKVTWPPPTIAARKATSVQLVTTPPAQALADGKSSNATALPSCFLLKLIQDRVAVARFAFIKDSSLCFL